jgi:hypothetical protein
MRYIDLSFENRENQLSRILHEDATPILIQRGED